MAKNAHDTKARMIIDVATELFAAKGYDGVSIRNICEVLDMNISMISYYFGGKRQLYMSVLREQFATYETTLDEIIKEDGSALDELKTLCEKVSVIHDRCPCLSVISARESCNPSEEFKTALKEHEDKYNGGHLLRLIRKGQQEGLINDSLDAVYLSRVISMVLNSHVIVQNTCAFLHTEVTFQKKKYFTLVSQILYEGILQHMGGDKQGNKEHPKKR